MISRLILKRGQNASLQDLVVFVKGSSSGLCVPTHDDLLPWQIGSFLPQSLVSVGYVQFPTWKLTMTSTTSLKYPVATFLHLLFLRLFKYMGISPSTEPTKHLHFSHSKLVCVIILRGHPLFKISYYLKFAFSIIYTINKKLARHNVNSWQEQLKKFPSIP